MKKNAEIANVKDSLSLINIDDLPTIVSAQVGKLNELDDKVRRAMSSAKNANAKANSAHNLKVGWFNKGDVIESLQTSGMTLAEALVDSTAAQKVSFEFQTQLAEISKFLFGLGVTNIALNRSVVQQLEIKLSGKSHEKLTKLAQREIVNVVKQLKAQEDILVKQENLSKKVKLHDDQLKYQIDKDRQHDDLLKSQIEKDEHLDDQLKIHAKKDKQHEEQLKIQIEKDKQHDSQLKIQAEKNRQLDDQLNIHAEKDKQLGEQIDSIFKSNNQINELLNKHIENELKRQLELQKDTEFISLKLLELSNKNSSQTSIIDENKNEIRELNDLINSSLWHVRKQTIASIAVSATSFFGTIALFVFIILK